MPAVAYASWSASVPQPKVGRLQILAWASAAGGFCIGSPGLLSAGSPTGWVHLGWHEIERGGWNVETHRLSWIRHDGVRGEVELAEPGRLPELFRERVAASIAVQEFVALAGTRGVVITARRDLGRSGAITWHTTLTQGLSWQTAGVRETVDVVLAELRTEYDLG